MIWPFENYPRTYRLHISRLFSNWIILQYPNVQHVSSEASETQLLLVIIELITALGVIVKPFQTMKFCMFKPNREDLILMEQKQKISFRDGSI